ncbi:PREDICTED: pectin acetylesterase 11-like [Nicotiana attenuata]|uniref:pectin acetylesterase 11-like n=1 Tax=Nicotiana attenuata TaxID=49451 RepID=UPI000904E8C6|nr:PREDICTED: pectin acetylesterase 11-like [Nicotiana attenuata]
MVDFYNWNRVRVKLLVDKTQQKYCAGSSFTGDIEQVDPGSAKNLPPSCSYAMEPSLCFFPQNVVPYVETPLFIINSHYNSWHIENILVPKYLDHQHVWDNCKKQISNFFGVEFLKAFEGLNPSFTRGYFITSCHSHGAIMLTNFWLSPTSPRLLHKTIGEAVADWFFDRAEFHYIDLYPCARDCVL